MGSGPLTWVTFVTVMRSRSGSVSFSTTGRIVAWPGRAPRLSGLATGGRFSGCSSGSSTSSFSSSSRCVLGSTSSQLLTRSSESFCTIQESPDTVSFSTTTSRLTRNTRFAEAVTPGIALWNARSPSQSRV